MIEKTSDVYIYSLKNVWCEVLSMNIQQVIIVYSSFSCESQMESSELSWL